MQIDVIADNTIKITLNRADMLCYDIKFDSIDCNSPKMKEFIIEMVSSIKEKKNIDLDAKQLYIEAFPKKDGGYIIYISPTSEKISPSKCSSLPLTDIIVDFYDISNLINVSKILTKKYSCFITQSSLFLNTDTYRFIASVYSKAESKIIGILGEFGNVLDKNSFLTAKTNECFNLLLESDAVKVLSQL